MALVQPNFWPSFGNGAMTGFGPRGSFGPLGSRSGGFGGFGPFVGRGRSRAMGMYQQYWPGSPLFANALIPRPGGSGRKISRSSTLYFDTGSTTYRFPQQMVQSQWPALARTYRQTGNRILDPWTASQGLGSMFPQLQDPMSWNVLLSIMMQNGSWSFANGINGQTNYFQELWDLLQDARDQLVGGAFSATGYTASQCLIIALYYLEQISWTIDMSSAFGVGPGIYNDLLNFCSNFAVLVGDIDPEYTYIIFECIDRMFGDTNVLVQCLSVLGTNAQQQLKWKAQQEFWSTGSQLAQFIFTVL